MFRATRNSIAVTVRASIAPLNLYICWCESPTTNLGLNCFKHTSPLMNIWVRFRLKRRKKIRQMSQCRPSWRREELQYIRTRLKWSSRRSAPTQGWLRPPQPNTLLILWISEKEQLTITNTIGNRHAQCTTMRACIVGLFVCLYWQNDKYPPHLPSLHKLVFIHRGGWGEELENLPTDKQRTNRQTENSSKTETTLLLCGSSGERANK